MDVNGHTWCAIVLHDHLLFCTRDYKLRNFVLAFIKVNAVCCVVKFYGRRGGKVQFRWLVVMGRGMVLAAPNHRESVHKDS